MRLFDAPRVQLGVQRVVREAGHVGVRGSRQRVRLVRGGAVRVRGAFCRWRLGALQGAIHGCGKQRRPDQTLNSALQLNSVTITCSMFLRRKQSKIDLIPSRRPRRYSSLSRRSRCRPGGVGRTTRGSWTRSARATRRATTTRVRRDSPNRMPSRPNSRPRCATNTAIAAVSCSAAVCETAQRPLFER